MATHRGLQVLHKKFEALRVSKGRADADIFVILFSLKMITLFSGQIKIKYLHGNHELKSNCTNVRKVMDDLVCEHVVSKEKLLGAHRQQVLLVHL